MERKMFFDASPVIFEFAKRLRNNMTTAERVLWEELRKRKLGVRFKPQHPMLNYIVDFYCWELKLVIEIDGPIHNYKLSQDRLRSDAILFVGNEVIRFSNEDVINNLEMVLQKIKEKISMIRIKSLI